MIARKRIYHPDRAAIVAVLHSGEATTPDEKFILANCDESFSLRAALLHHDEMESFSFLLGFSRYCFRLVIKSSFPKRVH
jgi:hypothetical protein